MKIRTDFVSNSSSCSFTILSNASGKIPVLHDNFKDVLPNLFPEIEEPSPYSIGESYAYLDIVSGNEEDRNLAKTFVHLKNTTDYDWIKNELIDRGTFTCIDIEMRNQDVHDESQRELSLKNTILIIEKLLSLRQGGIENAFLTYSAMPIDITGDGWNGGDPMGPYAYTVDLYLNETKNGLFHVVDNKVYPKISKIGVDSNILGEIANIINTGAIEYENQK